MLSLSRSVWNMSFQLRADCIKILSKKTYPPLHRSASRVHFWLQAGFRQAAWGHRPSVCGESKTPPRASQISCKLHSCTRCSSWCTHSCRQSEPFCLRQLASQPVLSWLKKSSVSLLALWTEILHKLHWGFASPSVSCSPEHIGFPRSISSSKGLVLTFGRDTKLKHINHRFIYRISKSPSCGFGGEGRMVFRCENYDKTALRLSVKIWKQASLPLINSNAFNSLFS